MPHFARHAHDQPTNKASPPPVSRPMPLPYQPLYDKRQLIQAAVLLLLSVIVTWLTEHSALDIAISRLFYQQGGWLITKGSEPYAFVFYHLPKGLLIAFGTYLLVLLVLRYAKQYTISTWAGQAMRGSTLKPLLLPWLSMRDMGYLLASIITVPSVIGLLKAATHVSCPYQLSVFGGTAPYLSLWQDITMHSDAKCFPAAHASAGFALFALAYLPRMRPYRGRVLGMVALLGWVMGLYKMMIGDHFFSHTLVSMLVSWAIVCVLAWVFYRRAPLMGRGF